MLSNEYKIKLCTVQYDSMFVKSSPILRPIVNTYTVGSNAIKNFNPFQPKLILVHTTVTGTCRRAYKTCKNWPLCSYVG